MEARGEPGVYVSRRHVTQQANVSDPKEFLRIAQYLTERGFAVEGGDDYGFFVIILEASLRTPGTEVVRGPDFQARRYSRAISYGDAWVTVC